MVTSVLEKKILDVTSAILRLVDEQLEARAGGGGGGEEADENGEVNGDDAGNVFERNK